MIKVWGTSFSLIGDLIMSLPQLNYFKNKYRDVYIYFIIHKKISYCAPLFFNHPLIDKICISGEWSSFNNDDYNLASSCDLVIYKKGEKGSVTFVADKEINKGIFPVKPLKPTGAGDAFMGALIGALLKNYDIENSIEIGSAAAAIVVTKVGCAPAMPDLNEILEFMKNNNIN